MRSGVALLALALGWATGASAADDCTKPLQMVTSVPMTDAEPDGVVTIPISLNGVEKQFLFDTGGLFPQVSSEVVDELKLPRLQSAMEIYSISGAVSKSYTKVQNFKIGILNAPNISIPISPIEGVEGIFFPVALKAYDFDMDFANHKLSILWGDHCDGKVIYWAAKAVASMPITTRDYHITVPVTVDGHALTAVIDTGATTSTIRLDVAKYVFGLTPDSPDMKVIGHFRSDEKAMIYEHPFKTLTFEGVTVTNPKIAILTDIVNKNADHSFQTGSHIKTVSDDLTLPQVIVGMDVLRKLRIYLALKEKRLYVTEASPVAAAPP